MVSTEWVTHSHASRHSIWLSVVGFVISSSSANHPFWIRIIHSANLYKLKYFGMLTLQRKGSARVWAMSPARFLSPLMCGHLQLVTHICLSQCTIYICLLITPTDGSYSLNSFSSRRFREGIQVKTWHILGNVLDRYKLHGKVWLSLPLSVSGLLNYYILYQVGWFTSDGAAVICTTLCMLQNNPVTTAGWTAQDYDMM